MLVFAGGAKKRKSGLCGADHNEVGRWRKRVCGGGSGEWLFRRVPAGCGCRRRRVVVSAATTLTVLLLLQHGSAIPINAIGIGLMVSDPRRSPSRSKACSQRRRRWRSRFRRWRHGRPRQPSSLAMDCRSRLYRGRVRRRFGAVGGCRAASAYGMVGYISYFIGEVTRSQLRHLPFYTPRGRDRSWRRLSDHFFSFRMIPRQLSLACSDASPPCRPDTGRNRLRLGDRHWTNRLEHGYSTPGPASGMRR